MKTLFDEVRSEKNIFAAWRHVKRSALNSESPKIRGEAAEFEHKHQSHLRKIIAELRNKTFEFDSVEGVLSDKKARESKGKSPRPITISSMSNRVVQRAILQVLQPRQALNVSDIDTRFATIEDARLRKINEVNRSQFGVGGLMRPYGGVKPAVEFILDAMANGAKYYYRSDIKAFFTRIPTSQVIDFVRQETKDDDLCELLGEALEVRLNNAKKLGGYAGLFPSDGIGVAQGSSLSAFAGNILLFDMDHGLNELGVRAVRYIDDLVILAKTESDLDKAVEYAKKSLEAFGFSLYDPAAGSDKAARGMCSSAIQFLGCTIQPNRCVPSRESKLKLRDSIFEIFDASQSAIGRLGNGADSFDRRKSVAVVLDKVSKKYYGWKKAFDFCSDVSFFLDLDKIIDERSIRYHSYVTRILNKLPDNLKSVALGVSSLNSLK
ncbi:hypothetical protein FJU08_11640 [Martelella alba]|uniref:Reverse transcriptase domain-containing protein n=1 Tax=Martelella alba TaxID=2590451 RepID=A0A506UBW7_9HYPH|nr:reverse transcriptase domain-containing protein [Martelella alba]TPW30325.1 hypothetical protein FJU08_11640 [Martelella alba]